MNNIRLLPLLVVITTRIIQVSGHEADLLRRLFNNYSRDVRPRNQPHEAVIVSFNFAMTRFEHLDVKNRALTIIGWITWEWADDFVLWNPSDYGNISKIVVPATKVWLPDVALDNSITDLYQSSHANLFRVSIYSDGTVVWEPGGSFTTLCVIDIQFFPFDHQTCEILFTTWQYTKDMVELRNVSNVINTETFSQSGEWEVEYTKVKKQDWQDPSSPTDYYSEISMTIHAKRKFMYYFINIMVPCLMLSLLVLVVFHLPPDSGEKVSLGVTVLLAYSVFQLMIADNVPTSSDTTPILEIYLLFFMGESTFSVAIAVLVLNLHHRTEYKPPPDWLRRLVLDWMARVLFMRRTYTRAVHDLPQVSKSRDHHGETYDDDHHDEDHHEEEIRKSSVFDLHKEKVPSNVSFSEHHDIMLLPPSIQVTESQTSNTASDHRHESSSRSHLPPVVAKSALRIMKSIACMERSPSDHSKDEFMSLIKDTYRDLCLQRQSNELDSMLENEWKRIAKIVDRFFFVVTALLILVSTCVIFAVMPYAPHDADNT